MLIYCSKQLLSSSHSQNTWHAEQRSEVFTYIVVVVVGGAWWGWRKGPSPIVLISVLHNASHSKHMWLRNRQNLLVKSTIGLLPHQPMYTQRMNYLISIKGVLHDDELEFPFWVLWYAVQREVVWINEWNWSLCESIRRWMNTTIQDLNGPVPCPWYE